LPHINARALILRHITGLPISASMGVTGREWRYVIPHYGFMVLRPFPFCVSVFWLGWLIGTLFGECFTRRL
jgi:hypothetical protein